MCLTLHPWGPKHCRAHRLVNKLGYTIVLCICWTAHTLYMGMLQVNKFSVIKYDLDKGKRGPHYLKIPMCFMLFDNSYNLFINWSEIKTQGYQPCSSMFRSESKTQAIGVSVELYEYKTMTSKIAKLKCPTNLSMNLIWPQWFSRLYKLGKSTARQII
jgi:hypothetical protein